MERSCHPVDSAIKGLDMINKWNSDSLRQKRNSDQVIWKTTKTGDHMGFDTLVDNNMGVSPLRIYVYSEDGYEAWSSPIYVSRIS